jgi:hypothetical protein
MSEEALPTLAEEFGPVEKVQDKPENYKTLIIVLTLITTVVTSIVAGLQADASIRANTANRDSQYYAILASSELLRSGLESTYDFNTWARQSRELQESLVMQITSLELKDQGNERGVESSDLVALGTQARADRLKVFSVFFTDPRYAPATEDGFPNLEAYLVNTLAKANEITAMQNAAADEYHTWSRKADSYLGVLTIIAVAFFLFGLAQAVSGRIRLGFAIFGLFILLVASAWTGLILVM